MPTFNLLEEPWLPVRLANTPNPEPVLMGLRQVLTQAHEIVALECPNPIETLALNRLLAALVASIYPQAADRAEWLKLWRQGHFAADACDRYLAKVPPGNFDLFSPTHPFYGNPAAANPKPFKGRPPKKTAEQPDTIARLFFAASSGNNSLLFSHEQDHQPTAVTLAEAARALVATQAAAPIGGAGYGAGTLAGGAYFWLRGAKTNEGRVVEKDKGPNLFQALLLNLAPTEDVWVHTHPAKPDRPVWELSTPPTEQRAISGIREWLTFQSRSLLLQAPDEQGLVRRIHFKPGARIEKRPFQDPHLAYQKPPPQGKKEELLPVSFSMSRAIWRDSTAYLLQGTPKQAHPPRTFEWLAANYPKLGFDQTAVFAADVFGLVLNAKRPAIIEAWRHEQLTIPVGILSNPARQETLQKLFNFHGYNDANQQASQLLRATTTFVARAQHHQKLADLPREIQNKCWDTARQLNTEAAYWLALEREFDAYLLRIARANDENDELTGILKSWQQCLLTVANEAFRKLEARAFNSQTWRAYTEAKATLHVQPKATNHARKTKKG